MNIIGALPVILQNGTIADASQVMSDFNYIVNQVNANGLSTAFVAPGTLLSIQSFFIAGSSTYTPNASANKALIIGVGGGGGGGGVVATTGSTVSVGGGGASGARFIHYVMSGITSCTITIGAGGAAVSGGAGGNGGTTTIGAPYNISAPGGGGGNAGTSVVPPYANVGGAITIATGANILNAYGAPGGLAASGTGVLDVVSGVGGSSMFGGGGGSVTPQAAGQTASSPGAGGSGGAVGGGGGPATGGAGAAGGVLIFEFA